MELNNSVVHVNYSLLSIPELILNGSRGMATEAGNSISSGLNRILHQSCAKMFHTDHGKNKLLIWKLFCNADVIEQGIIAFLQSLNDNKKAEKAVLNITAEMLYNNNGLNILLENLDAIFQSGN